MGSWLIQTGYTQPIKDRAMFINRLQELDKKYTKSSEPLIVWGYFKPYHGEITREDLNKISVQRPIIVWQRSCHEIILNDAALQYFKLTEENFKTAPQYCNWKKGHVWEAGLFKVAYPVLKHLLSPTQFAKGLKMMSTMFHKGGLTTVCEQGTPQIDIDLELKLNAAEINQEKTPYRFLMVPNAMYFYPRLKSGAKILAYCDSLIKTNNQKMEYVKAIKFYVDGAIFSQLMIMSEPYEDHHHGAWMMQPEEQEDVFHTFWNANWDIHIHINGDGGLDTLLSIIDRAKKKNPNSQSKIFLEHYGYAREDQHKKVAQYGLLVSNNPYYYYELSSPYSTQGLGKERASKISSVGSLERLGVPISFHSDYFMAPAEPLVLVWSAVNRVNYAGEVLAPEEKMSLWAAMKAITIEAARSLRKENEIGSIKVGKKADFTILKENPFKINPMKIKDIEIVETVFEGKPFPIK